MDLVEKLRRERMQLEWKGMEADLDFTRELTVWAGQAMDRGEIAYATTLLSAAESMSQAIREKARALTLAAGNGPPLNERGQGGP